MHDHPFFHPLTSQRDFFNRATACFSDEHAGFAPKPGMFTVAMQVAHVANTLDWFIAGAFSPNGFDMDFAAHENHVRQVTSLAKARQALEISYEQAIKAICSHSRADLQEQYIAPGPIMGGTPRVAIVTALADHTAHHRGSLSVYARLLGLIPAMPYA